VIGAALIVLAAAPIAGTAQGTPKWAERARFAETHATAYDNFGAAVAVYGDVALAGVPRDDTQGEDSGAVYVYARSGTDWKHEALLVAGDGTDQDWFGASLRSRATRPSSGLRAIATVRVPGAGAARAPPTCSRATGRRGPSAPS